MSGPKSIGYEVERLAAVRAQALAVLRTETVQMRQRAGHLAVELQAAVAQGVGDLPSAVTVEHPNKADPIALGKFVQDTRAALLRAEGELAKALRTARTAAGLAALASGSGGCSHRASDALAQFSGPSTPTRPHRRQNAASRIARLLDRVPSDIPPAIRERVAELGERAAATGAPQIIDELALLVDRAGATVQAAADARKLLDAALALPGLQGLRADLAKVEAGGKSPDAQQWNVWRVAVDQVRASVDRAYLLRTAADALATLGYAVGPDFATALAAGRHSDAATAGRNGYAARFRIGTDGALNVNIVRDVEDSSDDAEAERVWCEDVAELRLILAGSGVSTAFHRAVPAGTASVQQVASMPRSSAVTAGPARGAGTARPARGSGRTPAAAEGGRE